MGRAEPSKALPPPSARKAARAKQAKETLNKIIPALLSAHPRARLGVASSELISSTAPLSPLEDDEAPPPVPKIRVLQADTLLAAAILYREGRRVHNTAVLNMASPLRPGGGFLTGAIGQEELLCTRTTVLPSLREEFYRLPEVGAVFTPDVLVFRNAWGDDLPKSEYFYIDVVTAGMLRFPDIENEKYVNSVDAETMLEKMKAVMRVMVQQGARSIVLGAWGCGAYGNPAPAVAETWKKVLFGSKKQAKSGKGREFWRGVEEIVFAITDARMADVFKATFEDAIEDVKTKSTRKVANDIGSGDTAETTSFIGDVG